MKKLIIFIVCAAAMVVVDSLFFEYCISRPCEAWIQQSVGVAVITINIYALVRMYKLLIDVLQVDVEQKPKNDNSNETKI